MKFDENVNEILKKYPLNEDLGNIFGTLGQMVKNKVKYILEPMTEPFNQAKPDLSKGDDIIEQVANSLIEDQTIANKKLKYFKNDEQIPENRAVSYNDLKNPSGLKGKNPNYDKNVDDPEDPRYHSYFQHDVEIKNIIQIIDLNKLNLNINDPIIKQKIKEIIEKNKIKRKEYGEVQTRADLSPDRLYQRYQYLIKGYFKPFSKNADEKIKWLYILAKDKQEIKFTGKLPESTSTPPTTRTPSTSTRTPSTSGTPTPTSSPRSTPTRTSTPTPTRTPRARPPAPTRVVRRRP